MSTEPCCGRLRLLFMVLDHAGWLNSGPWNRWFFFHWWGCYNILIFCSGSRGGNTTVPSPWRSKSWCSVDIKWSNPFRSWLIDCSPVSNPNWIVAQLQGASKETDKHRSIYGLVLGSCCRGYLSLRSEISCACTETGFIPLPKAFWTGIYVFYIWDGASGYCKHTICYCTLWCVKCQTAKPNVSQLWATRGDNTEPPAKNDFRPRFHFRTFWRASEALQTIQLFPAHR